MLLPPKLGGTGVAALNALLTALGIVPRLLPAGGTSGQVLTKKTATDNDFEWRAASGASTAFFFSSAAGNLTAGQQTFTIPGGYTPGTVIAVANGLDLYSDEFTATNGTSITITGFTVEATDKLKFFVGLTAGVNVDWSSVTGKPNVAVLDGNNKLPASLMPSLAINDVFTVASEAAMLALTAERGDIAIRTDTGAAFTTYILSADTPGTLSAWVGIPLPASVVKQIAGLSGPTITVAQLLAAIGTTAAAQLWTNVADKLLTVNTLWAANIYTAVTWASALAVDGSTGLNFKTTLAGATTITFGTMKPNQSGVIKLTQDSTGGRAVTWGTGVNVGTGAPALNTAAGKNSWVTYFYDADLGQTVVGLFSKDA